MQAMHCAEEVWEDVEVVMNVCGNFFSTNLLNYYSCELVRKIITNKHTTSSADCQSMHISLGRYYIEAGRANKSYEKVVDRLTTHAEHNWNI